MGGNAHGDDAPALFSEISVLGADPHPLYAGLTADDPRRVRAMAEALAA